MVIKGNLYLKTYFLNINLNRCEKFKKYHTTQEYIDKTIIKIIGDLMNSGR